MLGLGKLYWIRTYRDDAPWQPARRIQTSYGDGWEILGMDVPYYDTEVNEVGPEIIPPQPRLVLDGPPYFEDDQECGYCQRPIGSPHEKWCRQ